MLATEVNICRRRSVLDICRACDDQALLRELIRFDGDQLVVHAVPAKGKPKKTVTPTVGKLWIGEENEWSYRAPMTLLTGEVPTDVLVRLQQTCTSLHQTLDGS